ncbi:hypothetical protein J6590_001523 [Homalodisca vitripennis]|nr:hypothetical protein J6590_001523 [Homalodisca vitripennis]
MANVNRQALPHIILIFNYRTNGPDGVTFLSTALVRRNQKPLKNTRALQKGLRLYDVLARIMRHTYFARYYVQGKLVQRLFLLCTSARNSFLVQLLDIPSTDRANQHFISGSVNGSHSVIANHRLMSLRARQDVLQRRQFPTGLSITDLRKLVDVRLCGEMLVYLSKRVLNENPYCSPGTDNLKAGCGAEMCIYYMSLYAPGYDAQ